MRVDGNSAYDDNNNDKRKWNFRYTMIAIIGILIVAAAALIAFDDTNRWTAEEDKNIDLNQEENNDLIGGGGINVVQPVPTVDSRETPEQGKAQPAPESNKTNLPVNDGKVTLDFSGDSLVYSKTLDQYVVHKGIDIEAPVDTPVMAVAEGTVTKVYNDDKLGITIELTHNDGYVTRYCSLSTDRMVEEGDVVKAGDVISGVGITALFESMDGPHLHFEVLKSGEHVDPAKFIDL